MAWIEVTDENEAEGRLARVYDASRQRASRVANVIKAQSSNPPALQGCMGLYQAIMFGESPLSRAQREMLAVVVSKANECHY